MNKLKKLIWLIFLFALGVPAWATTTLRLHLASAGTTGYQGMSLAQGPFGGTAINSVTYTTASGTSIQFTDANHANNLAWMSEPFASGVTLSGTETCNIWAKEASAANNASFECQLFKYSSGSLGSAFCTAIYTTELSTSVAAHAPTCSATSTAFSTGDQLVMIAYVINCATSGCPSGTMGAGSPGVTVEYDGPTASSAGDSYVSLAETVTFTPVGGSGGTPSCSNYSDHIEPPIGGFGTAAGYQLIELPHATGTGNVIIVGVKGSSGDTITETDDVSNTYYLASLENDSTNGQIVQLSVAPNITGSSRPQIKISNSTGDGYVAVFAMECTNVATANILDGSMGNAANSNTVQGGASALAPTVSGDLAILFFWNDWNASPAITAVTAGSGQTGITWALTEADRWQATGMQAGVYSSTTALNPQMTTTGTAGFAAAAIYLKSANAGTAFPTGIQINCMKTFWLVSSYSPAYPRTEQWPCPASNNAMIADWIGGSTGTLTSVSDNSGTNTWGDTGSAVCNNSCTIRYFTCGASTSTCGGATVSPTQTVTLNGTELADSAKFYGISGGSTTHFWDSAATCTSGGPGACTATGSQGAAGNLSPGNSITPSTASGIVIASLGVANNTILGVTGSGQYFTGCFWSLQTVGNGGCDENNGWVYYRNPNTSSVGFNFTEWNGSTAAGGWAFRADAFEAPSSTKPPNAFPRVF